MIDPHLSDLYQDVLREHAKSPSHYRKISPPYLSTEGYNPVCGDKIELMLKLHGTASKIDEIGFQGSACSICIASSSMMCELMDKKTSHEGLSLIEKFRGMMQGESIDPQLGDEIASLQGIQRFPVRIKCALLPWMALKDILSGSTQNKG